jgi:two-component system sensor histidine kinase BaeS
LRRPGSLARTLLLSQLAVILVGAVTLTAVAFLITPALFTYHLELAGETDHIVQHHALQALASTVAVAGAGSVTAAIIAAALASWFLVLRITRPIDDLSSAAEAIQRGEFPAPVSCATSQDEIAQLVTSFNEMVDRLERTEESRLRLLADLSHELRTPLATLEAYIDGLEDAVLEPTADSLDTMRSQVARMRRLTGDLAIITAAGEHALDLQLAPVPCDQLLEVARAAVAPRFEAKGVTLAVSVPVPSYPVLCDEARIQQVLANLLENSLRHTPAGGNVLLSAHAERNAVVIEVRDSGEGIQTDKLHVVFERFVRLDPSRSTQDGSGSGLGLAIAREIVRGHGGEITAESAGRGSGTTMQIHLPVSSLHQPRRDRPAG